MINRLIKVTLSLLIFCIVARGCLAYQEKLNTNEREALTQNFQQLMNELRQAQITDLAAQSSITPEDISVSPGSSLQPSANPTIPNHQSEEMKNKLLKQLGNLVIGEIEIPKINLKYIILDGATDKNLKLSIVRFYGPDINQPGNVALAGHNMWNGSLFGMLHLLANGDLVKLTDLNGVTKSYTIIDHERVREDNMTPLHKYEQNGTYVTLITCDTNEKYRIVYYAQLNQ